MAANPETPVATFIGTVIGLIEPLQEPVIETPKLSYSAAIIRTLRGVGGGG